MSIFGSIMSAIFGGKPAAAGPAAAPQSPQSTAPAADNAPAMIRAARTPSWNSTDVQRLGAGRIRVVMSAIATSATAVVVTVSTYERSDAACRAGPMRRLMVSRTVRVPEYNRSA